jgi:transcriptional regulator GlxA family with amidase domain
MKRFSTDLLAGILSSEHSGCLYHLHRSVKHPGLSCCLRALSRNPRLKLCDLADLSGLSLRSLHNVFRTHLGCTPGAILVMLRLSHACDLLANSCLPVSEIAPRCGYRSGNSLYVALRRYLGVAPMCFRRRSLPRGRGDLKRQRRLRRVPLPLSLWQDAQNVR